MLDFSFASVISGLIFLAFSLVGLFILRLLILLATDEEGFPIGVRLFEATIAAKGEQEEKLDLWTEYRILDLLFGRIRRLKPDSDVKTWWFVGLKSRNLQRVMFQSRHESRGVVLLHLNRGCYLRWRSGDRPATYDIDLRPSSRKRFRRLIGRPTPGEVDDAEKDD